MVMYTRKPTRASDGCNDRRDSQSYQAHKSQPKSQASSLHRYDKLRDGLSDQTPPYKMLRRSEDSPVNKYGENAGHGKAKASHLLRGKNGTSSSPQENSLNNSANAAPSKPADRDPADDWTEHISSSGKRYYYNCRTEVSQWEKPKDLLEREQRQKESVKIVANSFPKDMDYRQEALQDKATPKSTSGDQPTASISGHSSSSSTAQSLNSAAATLGSTQAAVSSASSSSTSTMQVAAASAVQSQQSPALLQDPALLHQLLPALQATLQMNNGNIDMSKINEVLAAAVTQASLRSVLHKLLTSGPAFNITSLLSAAQHPNQAQQSSQSPVSLTSDASPPRPYVSPRNGTPQSGQKSTLSGHSTNAAAAAAATPTSSSQSRGSMSSGKQGSVPTSQTPAEKRPEDPRTLQQRSGQEISSSNHICCPTLLHGAPGCQVQAGPPTSLTPSLAAHFDEKLITHIQGWPSENTEKQAARLREDNYNMGSLYMSELCTEMKNLRSLVRVCEIQATLREQRILFLRQQSKELDKLKNQNSYMV